MRAFYWRWLKTAFTHSVGVVDLWTGLVSAALSLIDHYWPGLQLMTSYGWQVPVWALAGVMLVRLLMAPFWMWMADRSQSAEAMLRANSGDVEPTSLLDFARLAEQQYGWDLFSMSHVSGWQTWDFKSGLEHAANDGQVKFEGKHFGVFSSPPLSPFLRDDEFFQEIERGDWVKYSLRIDIPGMNFGMAPSNFEIAIRSSLVDSSNIRYSDVRLVDRASAIRWLETKGPNLRGQRQEWYRLEEERRAREREPLEG